MKLLVITSCTNSKIAKLEAEQELNKEDFLDGMKLKEKENQLEPYKAKAKDMYTGQQHLWVMEGVNNLRYKFDHNIVDLAIVSAGFGLLDEDEEIVPYNVTFATMNKTEIHEWSDHLNINKDLSEKVKNYDLVVFLLGEEYLESLRLPLIDARDDQKLVFLGSKASRKLIPDQKPYYYLEVGNKDAKEFGKMAISLKGYLFKLLAEEIAATGIDVLEQVYDTPNYFLEVIAKHKKAESQQLTLFEESPKTPMAPKAPAKKKATKAVPDKVIVPEGLSAKNYGFHKLKYFMPENDDRVDPNFNFYTEEHAKDRNPQIDDVYAHEIYKNHPSYDGVLISKKNTDQTKNREQDILAAGGFHKFLRLPTDLPLYGDCGAFSYVDKEVPIYQTEEILDYYEKMGFDIGVSIDHLIIGDIAKDIEKRNFRYELTLKNAKDFIEKHTAGNYTFTPSGAAQGWDIPSYKNAVAQLIEMGYRHISLGGLAFAKSEEILEILIEIAPLVPEYLELHLFGAARLDSLDVYHQLGITSFDSTSYLKKAWGSAGGGNYFDQDMNKYAALRVPQVDISKDVKEMIEKNIGTYEFFKDLEQSSLSLIRKYDQGEAELETTLETLIKYDTYFQTIKKYRQKFKAELKNKDEEISSQVPSLKTYFDQFYEEEYIKNKHRGFYIKVLEDMPWKKCNCEICQSVGVEVIIFRGNNRNRRRGFHNTHSFYNQFQSKMNHLTPEPII